MTIVYSQNFDSTTVGTLPSAWNPISSSAWTVTNSTSISSPNALVGPGASGDGTMITCTAAAALADMEVRYDVGVVAAFVGCFVRVDSGAANGYLLIPDTPGSLNSTGGWDVYKRVGGSFTKIDNFAMTGLSGNISLRVRAQGSTLSFKIWSYGTTEPTGWSHQTTDTSITAAGYFGFYNQGVSSTGGLSVVDNVTLDNLVAGATDFTLTPSTLTTAPGVATGNYTVTPNGTPASSTTVALSDGGAGGTFSPSSLTFTTSTAQTFTYTPSSGGTTSPITLTASATGGFTASHTTQCVLNIPATGFSLSPSTLSTTAGVATGNYTVALNGSLTSNETIALSDGGASGTFSPTSLTFTSANAATPQTFTYTPASGSGGTTKTLTASGTGQFTASHNASCVVSTGPTTFAVTNAGIFWPPGSWDHLAPGTFGVSVDTMQATAPGPGPKFAISGTVNLSIGIDNATETGFPGIDLPIVRYSIDGAAFTDVQLTPSQTSLVLSSSLSTGSHSVEIYFKSSSQSAGYSDVWGSSGVSPNNVLRINGITADAGSSLSLPTLLAKRAMIFGDSIGAGEHVNTDGSDDSTQSFAPILARALNAEFGQICYGGQGWEVAGGSNAIAFKNAYAFYSSGRARSFTGLDYAIVVHGTNDARGSIAGSTIASDVQAWLSAMRTACGSSTKLIVIVPPNGLYASNLAAGVTAYKTASGDTNAFLVDATSLLPSGAFTITFGSTTQWTYDGVHPLIYGHERIGAAYSSLAAAALGGALTSSGYSRSRVANA